MTLRELVSLVLDLPGRTPSARARLIGFAVIWHYSSTNGLPMGRVTRWRVLRELEEAGVNISDLEVK